MYDVIGVIGGIGIITISIMPFLLVYYLFTKL